MSDETRKPLTLVEVEEILSDIARNGDGADRIRALKMVMAQEAGNATLPEPFSDAEVIDRLARLIRAAGPTASQLAYRRAFPAAKRPIHHAAPKVTEADVAPIDKSTLPKTLRALYRMFPEIKRAGTPKGYPVKAGMAVKAQWCQDEALKIIMDREQHKHDVIAVEAQESASASE